MFKFEDKIDEINKVIKSKSGRWNLKRLSYIDFDDVAQIIRLHIYNKFDLWDQTRPIEKWASEVANNQIYNLKRNHYGRVQPPCIGCKFDLDGDNGEECGLTPSGKKCDECPLYKKWAKAKKNAYGMKLASSIEDNYTESAVQEFDMMASTDEFHNIMLSLLTNKVKLVYKLLYIDGLSEDAVAIQVGFKTTENRKPGYKQMSNIKNKIWKTAQYVMNNYDVIK